MDVSEPWPHSPALEVKPICDWLLNAITALLVQNDENVATTVNKTYRILALQQPEADSSERKADTDSEEAAAACSN